MTFMEMNPDRGLFARGHMILLALMVALSFALALAITGPALAQDGDDSFGEEDGLDWLSEDDSEEAIFGEDAEDAAEEDMTEAVAEEEPASDPAADMMAEEMAEEEAEAEAEQAAAQDTMAAAEATDAGANEGDGLDDLFMDAEADPATGEATAGAEAAGAEAEAEAEADLGPRLDEIIVTAQKRAENVQDVPISVSAIGGETIKENNIGNLNDLSLYTPNVKLQAIAPFGRINMRGLGSGTNRGFEQSVGLVIDGVFFARLQYLLDSMLDFERVEALRGPQGTLFGKNTIAGAMNIATGIPEPDFRMEGDVLYGEFDNQRYRGMVTGPVPWTNDALLFRLAGVIEQRDGYVENTYLNRDELNVDNFSVRGKLTWDTTFGLTLTGGLTVSGFEQNSWGIEFTHLEDSHRAQHAIFDPNVEDMKNYRGQADQPGTNTRDTITGIVQADYDIGDYTLTSVTGYTTYDEEGDIDADGGPMPFVTLLVAEEYKQFSEELRLASPPGESLEWQVGLYYFTNEVDIRSGVDILPSDPGTIVADSLLPQAVGSLFGAQLATALGPLGQPEGVDNSRVAYFQTSDSYAAFGQGTWRPWDDWAFVFGLRYTMEEKSVNMAQVLNGTGLISQGVAGWEEFDVSGSREETGLSPKFSVQYHPWEDAMVYFTVAKGFKGGGYNASAVTADEIEYDEEEAINYEGGIKSEFLNGAARLNIGAFYTEFSNLQVSVFSSTQFIVKNAADAVTQGLEAEFMMVPMEGVMLMASGAWTDAHFTSIPEGTCPTEPGAVALAESRANQPVCDLSGNTLQRAPEWTANLSINYTNPLGNLPFDFYTGVDALYQDEFYLAVDADPFETQEAYTQFNARIGLRADDDSWQFAVFGRNLTDEVVMVTAADAPLQGGSHFAVLEPPRMISMEFTVRY